MIWGTTIEIKLQWISNTIIVIKVLQHMEILLTNFRRKSCIAAYCFWKCKESQSFFYFTDTLSFFFNHFSNVTFFNWSSSTKCFFRAKHMKRWQRKHLIDNYYVSADFCLHITHVLPSDVINTNGVAQRF